MKPVIDHIQLTVRDLGRAEIFYDKVLPLLGFDVSRKLRGRVDAHDFDVVEYPHPELAFGINSPRAALAAETVHRRRPGSLHHLAFKAPSREEVDRLGAELAALGVEIVGGPQLWPQHGEGYYAVFFKDPDGIKLEIVHSEEAR